MRTRILVERLIFVIAVPLTFSIFPGACSNNDAPVSDQTLDAVTQASPDAGAVNQSTVLATRLDDVVQLPVPAHVEPPAGL